VEKENLFLLPRNESQFTVADSDVQISIRILQAVRTECKESAEALQLYENTILGRVQRMVRHEAEGIFTSAQKDVTV
jgi:hypothetical protein